MKTVLYILTCAQSFKCANNEGQLTRGHLAFYSFEGSEDVRLNPNSGIFNVWNREDHPVDCHLDRALIRDMK